MKTYTLRIIGGTNEVLLDEMIEDNFYLPDDCYDAYQDEPQIKTTVYDDGFDIHFSVPDRFEEANFKDWIEKIPAKMYDDSGYDWWNYGGEDREVHALKSDDMVLIHSLKSY